MNPLPHQAAHPSGFLVALYLFLTLFAAFGLVCYVRDIVRYLRDRTGRLD